MISDGKNELLTVGVNKDVLSAELDCYQRFREQPRELVSSLHGMTIDEQCRSLFAYLVERVIYRLDPAGDQYIKSPARLLADGEGDCKSLTMFFVCCLHCLGISHKIRFVNFDGTRQYSHVYAVALDENGEEIILDACEIDMQGYPIYNFARQYNKKKDYTYYER